MNNNLLKLSQILYFACKTDPDWRWFYNLIGVQFHSDRINGHIYDGTHHLETFWKVFRLCWSKDFGKDRRKFYTVFRVIKAQRKGLEQTSRRCLIGDEGPQPDR